MDQHPPQKTHSHRDRVTRGTWLAGLVLSVVGNAAAMGPIDRFLDIADRKDFASLESYAQSHPGNPIVQGQRALLLFPPTTITQPVVGDFNGWGAYPAETTANMERVAHAVTIGDERWRYVLLSLGPEARLQYALEDADGSMRPDPRNPRVVLHFGVRVSEFSLSDADQERNVEEASRGRLEAHELVDAAGVTRVVQVYRPGGTIAREGASLPVVVFNDGTAYIDRMALPSLMDTLLAASRIRPFIAVFADPHDRREDYGRSAAFRRYVSDVLLPFLESRFPVSGNPDERIYVGSSRGALAVLDYTLAEPPWFGRVMLLAPALTPTDVVTDVPEATPEAPAIDLLGGRWDLRFIGDYHTLANELAFRGYRVRSATFDEGHNQAAWRRQLPALLARALPPRPEPRSPSDP